AANAHHVRNGGNVHDGPTSGGLHVGDNRTRHLERANDVDGIDPLEVFGTEAVKVRVVDELRGAGVVYQRVDTAPFVESGSGHAATIGIDRDIRLHQQGVRAERFTVCLCCARFGFALRVVDDDVATFGCQHFRRCSAHAGGRAGDDRYSAVDVHESLLQATWPGFVGGVYTDAGAGCHSCPLNPSGPPIPG